MSPIHSCFYNNLLTSVAWKKKKFVRTDVNNFILCSAWITTKIRSCHMQRGSGMFDPSIATGWKAFFGDN
jgi:hypothetical protein